MKKTIEVLKNAGIIDKFQKSFNRIKLPLETSDGVINKTITDVIQIEFLRNSEIEYKMFDAIFEDMSEAVKNELTIKYAESGSDGIMGAIATVMKMITDELEKEGE